jgi:hypothetical protein
MRSILASNELLDEATTRTMHTSNPARQGARQGQGTARLKPSWQPTHCIFIENILDCQLKFLIFQHEAFFKTNQYL